MTQQKNISRTLVLGGGGVTGIAWMTGILSALEKNGFDVNCFDKVIGTSAGSAVAAQITSNTTLDELFKKQIDSTKQVAELTPSINYLSLILRIIPALLAKNQPEKFRQKIGKLALKTKTVAPQERERVIKERLPCHEWPTKNLCLVAVNADSGQLVCFDKNSKTSLVDAVSASCAVPGVWPAVLINQAFYIDGAMRSADNADLALGSAFVLILSPLGLAGFSMPGSSLQQEIKILEEADSKVLLISPDKHSKISIGKNPLDPSKRQQAAEAGFLQGSAEANKLINFFK